LKNGPGSMLGAVLGVSVLDTGVVVSALRDLMRKQCGERANPSTTFPNSALKERNVNS
jgi:hypothetical protein